MNIFSRNKKHKIIQEKQRMSSQFAWITTALIAIVSLLIVISVMSFFSQIIKELQAQSYTQNFYISSRVFDEVISLIDTDRNKIEDTLTPALKNKAIAYVTVKNKKTNKIIYSIDAKRKFHNSDKYYENYAPQYTTPKYEVTVGFFENTIISSYIKEFLNKISILTASCIFFGLLMSYFMFKIINKPLEELIMAAQKFKQGNFTAHLQKSHYEEINTLVDTYNSMADSLNELYTSLELKVEERAVELENAYKELQDTQAMMVHSEKMRSLGGLVAGITHEINNPVNFIYGNLIHLKNYSEDLIKFIEELIKLSDSANDEIKQKINDLKKVFDYDFIQEDLPALIKSCQEGAERTKNIIMDLKNFSRMGEKTTASIDLVTEIDTTLNILHNKLKNRITIHKDYADNMPKIDALGGQLNQVFMNILDNAAYAIKGTGNIKIIMRYDKNYVTIKIADDGCGMSKESAEKIFDPFYTTKPVGEGTGLGMSISYKVIKNHNGDIKVESEEGKGTTFTITLPIENKEITKGM